MSPTWTRRQLLRCTFGCALAAGGTPSRVGETPKNGPRSFGEIEASVGGRVGVFALDTGTGRQLGHLPLGWTVGDKTGTGRRGSVNDVAIAWPPGAAPVVIAAYSSDSRADLGVLARAHADIGRLVAEQL